MTAVCANGPVEVAQTHGTFGRRNHGRSRLLLLWRSNRHRRSAATSKSQLAFEPRATAISQPGPPNVARPRRPVARGRHFERARAQLERWWTASQRVQVSCVEPGLRLPGFCGVWRAIEKTRPAVDAPRRNTPAVSSSNRRLPIDGVRGFFEIRERLYAAAADIHAILINVQTQAAYLLFVRSGVHDNDAGHQPISPDTRESKSWAIPTAGVYELRFVTSIDPNKPGTEAHLLIDSVKIAHPLGAEVTRLASLSCVGRVANPIRDSH